MPFESVIKQREWSPGSIHQGDAFRRPQQIMAANGAITLVDGEVFITKGSAAALTLAAPPVAMDGANLLIQSTTAFAHTITQTTPGFNGGSTGSDVVTFGGAIGDALLLTAYQGVWLIKGVRNVSAEVGGVFQFPAAAFLIDGAITLTSGGIARLTKATAGDYTLAAPALNDVMLIITAATAAAHVVTYATGFGAGGGSLDVATFGGAIGDNMVLIAVLGTWYIVSLRNVTIA